MKKQNHIPAIRNIPSFAGGKAHHRPFEELPVPNNFLIGNIIYVKQRLFQSADNDSATGGDHV